MRSPVHQLQILLRQPGHSRHVLQVLQEVLLFPHSHGAQSQLKAPNTAPAPLVSTPTKDKKENKENSECGVKVEEGSKVEV